jgi:hypothetical protein
MMRTTFFGTMALAVALALPSAAHAADPELDEEGRPPTWGVEGPYRLDVLLAGGIGVRLDDPPRFAASSRAVPMLETGLDLFLSERLSFGLHYARLALAPEDSGILPIGHVRLDRSVDLLWLGLRFDPLHGETIAGYLRLGPGLAWQHLDVSGFVWPAVTPGQRAPISCGATALGFGIRAAAGVDVELHDELRFLAEVGADNLRLTSDVIGGCGPGAGTATVLGLRGGFVYGLPL